MTNGDYIAASAPLITNQLYWGNGGADGTWKNGVGVQSTYNYRGMPIGQAMQEQGNPNASGTVPIPSFGHVMYYPKPMQMAYLGMPMFKTTKQLGGRAIVSDTWSKYNCPTTYAGTSWSLVPGLGWQVHKDGYNVLYGDGSAQWYGDAQQQIMWWPDFGTGTFSDVNANNNLTLGHTAITRWAFQGSSTYNYNTEARGMSDTVWHLLDAANGVDVR
jgi:prepilin-type processing-associated H-X9-DG protein